MAGSTSRDIREELPATGPDTRNALTLKIGATAWKGWQDIRLTRGCERVPSDFALDVTEKIGDGTAIAIEPGAECQVLIGDDVVLTGFIDRYGASISYASHSVKITGRGKCQDLVDCSINPDGLGTQIGNAFLFPTAQRLARPYGVEVINRAADGFIAESLGLFITETPFDVIQRLSKAAGRLAYEDELGRLVLDIVGTERQASGFVQGVNIQRAEVTFAMDGRFSEYRVVMTRLENLDDIASRNANADWNTYTRVRDPGVPRNRLRTIVVEQNYAGQEYAFRRGNWEMARRYGRSQAVTLVVDSWRDKDGQLWTPNRRAQLHLPALKLEDREWLIGEVTFRRGRDGETAEVLLMPPEAYAPEPTILAAFDNQVAQRIAAAQRVQ